MLDEDLDDFKPSSAGKFNTSMDTIMKWITPKGLRFRNLKQAMISETRSQGSQDKTDEDLGLSKHSIGERRLSSTFSTKTEIKKTI